MDHIKDFELPDLAPMTDAEKAEILYQYLIRITSGPAPNVRTEAPAGDQATRRSSLELHDIPFRSR